MAQALKCLDVLRLPALGLSAQYSSAQRRSLLGGALGLGFGFGLALAGCGGGGDAQPIEGSRTDAVVNSRLNATEYLLKIYLPPASAGPRSALPVLFVLDGDSWFETLVALAEATRKPIIVVAIGNAGQRSRDFVPANTCTANGGGHGVFLNVLRSEILPQVQAAVGGDPSQRALFGHSHGASFALYAMFSELPGQHTFKAYLACDSSVLCMPTVAYGWDSSYAAAQRQLPVRLHFSCATQGNYASNLEYGGVLAQRRYEGLAYQQAAYVGTHGGIVPQALADGIGFAFPS